MGKKLSDETKKKISIAHIGIGHPMSEELKRKISLANIGRKRPDLSERNKHRIMSREKHWNWQGGITSLPYSLDWTDNLRENIRKRDEYVCQLCGVHQDELTGRFKVLDIHHIDYNKFNCNPDNLISLCRGCHMKTNYDRQFWGKYFQII